MFFQFFQFCIFLFFKQIKQSVMNRIMQFMPLPILLRFTTPFVSENFITHACHELARRKILREDGYHLSFDEWCESQFAPRSGQHLHLYFEKEETIFEGLKMCRPLVRHNRNTPPFFLHLHGPQDMDSFFIHHVRHLNAVIVELSGFNKHRRQSFGLNWWQIPTDRILDFRNSFWSLIIYVSDTHAVVNLDRIRCDADAGVTICDAWWFSSHPERQKHEYEQGKTRRVKIVGGSGTFQLIVHSETPKHLKLNLRHAKLLSIYGPMKPATHSENAILDYMVDRKGRLLHGE